MLTRHPSDFAKHVGNIYTLFTFSARPIRLNSPATCINDWYGSEVSPPTEMFNSEGLKLFGEEFTRGWGLVLQVTKNLQTAKRTACQSSLPTVPRGFSSAATPSSFKKAKSRKKASKKNFRAILDLLAGGAGTEASYINTHSQTPPGWRIIRPPPCHLPLNITAKKHRYLERGHRLVEMNMQGASVCSFMTLSLICRKMAWFSLCAQRKQSRLTATVAFSIMPCLDGDSPPIPQGPAVPRPPLSLPGQYQKTSRPPRDYQSKQVDRTPLEPSVKVGKVKISSVTPHASL